MANCVYSDETARDERLIWIFTVYKDILVCSDERFEPDPLCTYIKYYARTWHNKLSRNEWYIRTFLENRYTLQFERS